MKDKSKELFNHLHRLLSEGGFGAAYQPVLRFLLVLSSESDRGMVLAGAAFIDNALVDLLKSYFTEESNNSQLFSGNGSLATFSSRIEIAYSLGLIDSTIKRDITIVRRIRNEFAHTDQQVCLTDTSTQNRINELTSFCQLRSLIRKFEKKEGDFDFLDELIDPKLSLLFNLGVILIYIADVKDKTTRTPTRIAFLDEMVEMATTEFLNQN